MKTHKRAEPSMEKHWMIMEPLCNQVVRFWYKTTTTEDIYVTCKKCLAIMNKATETERLKTEEKTK